MTQRHARFSYTEFATVARGNTDPPTSCEFVADVRNGYVNQSQCGVAVTLDAWSPLVHEWLNDVDSNAALPVEDAEMVSQAVHRRRKALLRVSDQPCLAS